MDGQEKVCKQCGKTFVDNSVNQSGIYCSRSCSKKFWYKINALLHKKSTIKLEKTCKNCGKNFIDNSKKHIAVCCSHKCANKLWYDRSDPLRRKVKIEMVDRECPECGKVFSTNKKKKRKFCSTSCANNYWVKNNLERHRNNCRNARLKEYKISAADYESLLKQQNYKCAICHKTVAENKKKIAVDHDHITNKIRGLLCDKCNIGLGHFLDNIELLKNAILYLESQ